MEIGQLCKNSVSGGVTRYITGHPNENDGQETESSSWENTALLG